MSVLPRIALFLQYVLPRNSRNTQNLLAVYSPTDCTLLAVCSPTDCTDFHRTFLPYILPQIALFLQYVLPRNSRNTQNLLTVYSPTDCTDFHRCCFQGGALVSSAPTRSVVALLALLMYFLLCWCTSCSVGALETSAPPERTYLCRSVKSVGEYFQQPLP